MSDTPPPVHALGYSENDFDPHRPGRLCRGRERWIEPWPDGPEPGEVSLRRGIVTGAAFHDDTARDAVRGLTHVQVDVGALIGGLFHDHQLMVFTEDSHPADIPDDAEGVELYDGYRAGGQLTEAMVRWYLVLDDPSRLSAILGPLAEERVRGIALLGPDQNAADVWERLFTLVGMSTLDSPPARFQPAAMPEVLEHCAGLVLMHRDKHGPALGIYSAESLALSERLEAALKDNDLLCVPFAIPPMLARWDRALRELRPEWEKVHERPFPVPAGDPDQGWQPRRTRKERAPQTNPLDDELEALLAPSEDDAGPPPKSGTVTEE